MDEKCMNPGAGGDEPWVTWAEERPRYLMNAYFICVVLVHSRKIRKQICFLSLL